jgi:hypothetical protein
MNNEMIEQYAEEWVRAVKKAEEKIKREEEDERKRKEEEKKTEERKKGEELRQLKKQQREIENARYTFNYGFTISDELADFISGHIPSSNASNNSLNRTHMKNMREGPGGCGHAAHVQKHITEYMRKNNIQIQKNRKFKVDSTLKELFKLKDDEELAFSELGPNIRSHFKLI